MGQQVRRETPSDAPEQEWVVSKALLDALQRDESAWTAGALEQHIRERTYHGDEVDADAVLENVRRAILAHERSIEDLETVASLLESVSGE